jgi:hypothetical protein
MRILNISWPMVIVVTIVLYALIILSLPFSSVMPTVFLFALIAYWSRMPGSGIIHPLHFLYYMDVVDIFTMLVAIHVGPIEGIMFTLFCNYASRAAGIYPHWVMVIKDGIAQSLCCLLIPFVYGMLGGNIVAATIAYAIIRAIGFFLLWIVWRPWGLVKQLAVQISENAVVLTINIIYARFFGDFFSNLLSNGVSFNWVLFIFATFVILAFIIIIYGIDSVVPSKDTATKIVKNVVRNMSKPKQPAVDTQSQDVEVFKKDLGL